MNTQVTTTRRTPLLAVLASAGAISGLAQGAVVYEVNFDSLTGTTVNGVTGGTAVVVGASGLNTVTVETANSMGQGGYLSVHNENLTGANTALGVTLTPATAGSSWGAMSAKVDGVWKLNGGFDVFFCTTASAGAAGSAGGPGIGNYNGSAGGGELEMVDHPISTGSGVRMLIGNQSNTSDWGIKLLSTSTDAFGAGATTVQLDATTGLQIANNTIYHLGATFNTDASGVTTLRLFGKEGGGAIDTSSSSPDLLGSTTFNLNDSMANAFATSAYTLGIRNGIDNAKTQEFDRFRIYNADPGTFAAIPEPSSLLPITVAGLLLGRRRRRK